jgi:MOSC domain-containing protein YiiM
VSSVESVNVGVLRAMEATTGVSGIDKRPTSGPVWIAAPAPGTSGLAGDPIGDPEHHGGLDRAVYAYAREDLDAWRPTLGDLRAGAFGENLTTRGLEVTDARIGERWRMGADLVLEVAVPRIPCRTFAAWLEVQGWVKTFTRAAVPGAYLRVVRDGAVRAGDPVVVEHRPDHEVTIGLTFRAMTLEPDLLPRLLGVDALPADVRDLALRRSEGPVRADGGRGRPRA